MSRLANRYCILHITYNSYKFKQQTRINEVKGKSKLLDEDRINILRTEKCVKNAEDVSIRNL